MDLASLQNETHRPNFNRLGFSFVKVIVALLEKMKAYELRFHIQVDVTRQNPPTISMYDWKNINANFLLIFFNVSVSKGSLLWYENILTMIESFKSRLAVIGPNDPLISYNITNLIAKIVNVKDDYRNHMRYRFEGIHLDYL